MYLKLRIWAMIFMIMGFMFLGCSGDVKAGSTATDFTLEDLSGNFVSLKQYKGNIILLDFWATWCPPCLISIPELVDIQRKYKDKGLIILGISTDDPRKASDKSLLGFKKRYKINYSILRADYDVTMDYFGPTNMAIPTLFVVDRKGKVVDSIVGYAPGATERSLQKLL